MEQTGRLTLPTDADVVEETLRLKALLGADALRDCDGTEMPDALLQDPAKKYATGVPHQRPAHRPQHHAAHPFDGRVPHPAVESQHAG